MEDGYIPCPAGIECGMPSEWFPEFTRPLGKPLADATVDDTDMVWKRSFEHANVYVDLKDRNSCKIDWF